MTAADRPILLQASGVTFAYGPSGVLHDVSLTLAAGEVVALLGPNGSGKSTLIKLLLGHLAGTGNVLWDGKDIRQWRRRDLARRVAYLAQSPAWDAEQRVADVLRAGRAPYWSAFGLETDRDVEVVQESARTFELTDLVTRRMDELSGGQRQRVFLARCLAQQPAAMLLDEPNTFLDLKHQVETCRLLRQLATDRGLGVLMASHDLNLAAAFADRLILLSDGKVAAAGSVPEVLRPEILTEVYGLSLDVIPTAQGGPVVVPRLT